MTTRNHLETIADDLRDPEFALDYLQMGWEDGLPTFLVSLRDVVTATIGMSHLAAQTGMSRESLYKTLSATGNPQMATLHKILSVLGYELRLLALRSECRSSLAACWMARASMPFRPRRMGMGPCSTK
jgi:probable addiction module antidote protein